MGTHPIFESDFDCLTVVMLVARLARANCKNFLACTNVGINRIDHSRQLSTGPSTGLLSRPMNKSLYHHNQRRELVAEITISSAFMGLYYMPDECGFNMLGGVVFFGFSSLLWLFILFELEIIMLLLQPTHDIAMPFFIGTLFCTWSYLFLFPAVNNI